MSDILSMSDEEILALSPTERDKLMEQEPAPEPVVEPTEEEQVNEPAPEPTPEPEPQPTPEPEPEPQPEEQPGVAEPEPAAQVDQPAAEPAKVEEPVEEEKPAGPTAEEQLNKLLSTFKASGRDFKVNSVDEAIQLMQKGVNYHDKMHGLKPVMGIARMLEREGLLNEGKLSFLIDLHKKNPEAIAKLVKESGVDPLEVDDNKVAAYKSKSYGLTPQENALEDALSELQQYQSHDRVIGMVSTKMDPASREVVLKNPSVLLHIADQVDSGVYDVIQAEVDKQRILGNLRGMNDLQAYDAVGQALNEQGAFNHLQKKQAPVAQQPAPVVVAPRTPAPKPANVAKVAAAPAKTTTAPPVAPKAFNPLAMSDEEFMKLAGKPL
ncbi:MAG: hypothetical protein DI616_15960 [Paracoccus denitrificans]|uniref:Uncharacterized protein n=1 Tax=Paracoccus denitrificans TaxID=266 RepID=A0A533I5Y4_PARDE|nr:MAG: hypothetical protein DI616_15960 [Paracoccus denitrificans]